MTTDNDNKFKYNAKELEDDHNLYWYHYGARYYDPQLGKWHSVDPVDEYHSPYVYVGNNPVNFIDPDGMGTDVGDAWAENMMTQLNLQAIEGLSPGLQDYALAAGGWEYQSTWRDDFSNICYSVSNWIQVNIKSMPSDGKYAGGTPIDPLIDIAAGTISDLGDVVNRETSGFKKTLAATSILAMGRGRLAQKLFKSVKFGVASTRFGNKFVLGVSGTWNKMGNIIKLGWSGQAKYGGGMQLRLGIGVNKLKPNQAWIHFYLPGTFVPNNIANPIMQSLRKSL
jgi:RHS repeat-associated protein